MTGGALLLLLPLLALFGRHGGGRAPDAPAGAGLSDVWALGRWVETTGSLPGFATFATAAAARESGGDNLMARGNPGPPLPSNVQVNQDAHEASAACDLYSGARDRGWYEGNRHPASWWCWGSGGWFGLLPATGLAAGGPDGPFRLASPMLVFDPIASVVMLADFTVRISRSRAFRDLPWAEQNWLAIRRGMAASSLIPDYDESSDRSRATRERLAEDLADQGFDPDFMFARVVAGDYPGADDLLRYLNQAVKAA